MSNGTVPAKGLYPWIVWSVAAVFYCYGFFQRVAPSVMVTELMTDFAVNAAVLGNLSAFYFYAYAGLQLPVGVFVDRWGARRMLACAALLCGSGSALFAIADSITMAYAGRLLIGAGAAFTWVGALKLAVEWLPPRRFAMITGMTLMLGMAGAVGGQAPLALAVAAVGWRATLMMAAVFAAGLAGVIWFVVRDRPQSGSPHAEETDMGNQASGLLRGLKLTLATPQSWIIAVFGAAITAPLLSFAGLWGVPYLMQAYGIDRTAAAATTSMMLIGWGIGAPLAGWASDYIHRRRLPMLIGSVAALLIFSVVIYVPDLPLLTVRILFFAHGLASGVMIIVFAVGREHNRPGAAGATLGFINAFVMASGAFFQPFIGWLLDANWDGTTVAGGRVYSTAAYETALLALVGCSIVTVLAAIMTRETRCQNVSDSGVGS